MLLYTINLTIPIPGLQIRIGIVTSKISLDIVPGDAQLGMYRSRNSFLIPNHHWNYFQKESRNFKYLRDDSTQSDLWIPSLKQIIPSTDTPPKPAKATAYQPPTQQPSLTIPGTLAILTNYCSCKHLRLFHTQLRHSGLEKHL